MQSVICFGAGIGGHSFIAITKNKINIEYFLDNGQSGQIENYRIYKPSAENCVGDGKYIVVTSWMYYESIKDQLESYGLRERIDFVSAIEFLMMNDEFMRRDWEGDRINVHLYLRKRKAAHYILRQMGQFPKKDELIFESYQNAVILPLKKYPGDKMLFGRGGVVDESGKYVSLSGLKDRIGGQYDYENPQYRDEKAIYCGYFFKHWGHFLIEVIARLWYFLKYDNFSDKYVFFVVSGTNVVLDGNYREFFRLLGILDKVEMINEPTQYKEVIVPQLSYNRMGYYSEDYKNIFSTVIDNAMKECKEQKIYDKVFLSRSWWSEKCGKLEYGLDMLDDFFLKNGFKVISPETLTITQMIFIIQKADIIASISGSTAHNILFGKDGQELIVIERCAMNNLDQTNINKIRQLDVTHIDANFVFAPVDYAGGPYLFACNKFLISFAEEREWKLPEIRFLSKDYVKKNVEMYGDCYNKRREIIDSYHLDDDIYREAYKDSMNSIRDLQIEQ